MNRVDSTCSIGQGTHQIDRSSKSLNFQGEHSRKWRRRKMKKSKRTKLSKLWGGAGLVEEL
jgi:hypothetical protein